MEKRKAILGGYDTVNDGQWTLAVCTFPQPEYQTNFVEVPGGLPLDLSTVLTDGEPTFSSRPLTIVLESSEGTRDQRKTRITSMVNNLHGARVNIVLPDYPNHYAVGRLSVVEEYNDLAHARVSVTGTCEPWLYKAALTTYTVEATETARTVTLANPSRRPVCPTIVVTGETATLVFDDVSVTLSGGTYQLPELRVRGGADKAVTITGNGSVSISYREAVL